MTPYEIDNEGGPSVWRYDAFGTRYRGMIVEIGRLEAAQLFNASLGSLIAVVEPAGAGVGRKWMTLARLGLLHQSYVEEKLEVRGEDAVALTILLGAMTGRDVGVTGERPE